MGLVLVLAGLSLAAAVTAWLIDRRRRQYSDQPTTPAAAVFAGRNEVAGTAWAAHPLVSYRRQVSCVWWDYVLEEERNHTRQVSHTDANGNRSTRTENYTQWHKIDSKRQALPSFEVVDETGSVEVRPTGAKLQPSTILHETFKKPREGGFFSNLGNSSTGRYRETEEAIQVGEELFVVGEAHLDEATATPFIAKGDKGNFLVSTEPESSHTGQLGFGVLALAIVSIGLLVGANAAAVGNPTWLRIGPAIVLAVIVLTVMSGIITYNRLKIVGQNAERAWSLIEVQLRRRANLIPALRAAVEAQQLHEETTIAAVTAARARLPEAGELAEATADAQAQTSELSSLWTRAEALPNLRAGAGFVRLQEQISDTENRIAGARTFYNDSVTLMRDRGTTFPGALVVRFVEMPHRELFLPQGFERSVPRAS